mgnify:CR=1 FL=1
MCIGYIKKENLNKKIFRKIDIRKYNENYIFAVYDIEKTKFQKRIARYIKKLNIDTLVFSKELDGEYKEKICKILSQDVNVLNGKQLMDFMKFQIVKYVLNKQNKDTKEENIYIILKKDSKINLNFLQEFIENFKMTNVVTNDIERLKNIQENLLENDGVLISISNNKRKALKRAKYVLNINLNKDELSKYNMNRDAIIINVQEFVKYDNPNFDGINIKYFEIKCPDDSREKFEQIGENFDLVKLYESMLLLENNQKISEKIKKDEVCVSGIIGNNGKILDEELNCNNII